MDPLKRDLDLTCGSFELLKAYGDSLELIADKSWIDFRGNVFELADHAATWAEKVICFRRPFFPFLVSALPSP